MLLKDFDRAYRRIIHEIEVPGKRLGRHIAWDPSNAQKTIEPFLSPTATVKTQEWVRGIPILNQGNIGGCTAFAGMGMAGTAPFYAYNQGKQLDNAQALTDYEYETTIDGLGAPYPPNDRGSSGQASVQTLVAKGFALEDYYALDFNTALLTVANYGPTIWGINWYSGFDDPSAEGIITVSGNVRGGHEVECLGIDVDTKYLKFANSWGDTWSVGGYFWLSFDDAETLFNQEGSVCTIGVSPPSTPVGVS